MPSSTADRVFFPVSELIDEAGWPLADLVPDSFEELWITSPDPDPETSTLRFGVLVKEELSLRVPGLEAAKIVVAPTPGGSALDLVFSAEPFGVLLEDATVALRVDAGVLRPLRPGSDEPDMEAETLDVQLGAIDLGVGADGNVVFDAGAASLPRCMVAGSGAILAVGALEWVTPADGVPGAPPGFTGLRLDDVEVSVPSLPQLGDLRMEDVFLGTGGFSGRLRDDLTLAWDGSGFDGDATGELFGFRGGLSSVEIEFSQSALVACSIAGDVFVPFLDRRIGLEIGLTGDGDVSAVAALPHTADPGVSAGAGDHLLHLEVLDLLSVDLDAIRFEAPAGGPAAIELNGAVKLDVDGLEMPPVGVEALRIGADGEVDIEGGWLDLPSGRIAPFHGFPLELSRIGFGTEGSGAARRNWVGLNGAVQLADGLPVGSSVEGLRVSWDAAASPATVAGTIEVSLDGVGLELNVPGAVEFGGSVSFSERDGQPAFRGHGRLSLPSVGVAVDADVVVGRAESGGTFFYFHLAADLPAGIPLFQTGAAFYGFEGRVTRGMAPDRREGEPWYHGWYRRLPVGTADPRKWAVREGAFAIGVGTTIGTFPDSGFAFHTGVLLIVVLPGPVLMLEGKGSFLTPRAGEGGGEGAFEALLVLDVPDKRFEANLAAAYEVRRLLKLRGGVDVAASWRSPPPPGVWHVYLGEEEPIERRWQAKLLGIFDASSYLMVERPGLRLGAWIGFDEDWRFGPVRVWARAEIEGRGEVAWKPTHFHGSLHLGGEVGVSAFGAKIVVAASAGVDAQGPTPWTVVVELAASISIDLWLFSFSWSATIHLEWGSPDDRPEPALPVVESASHEHLLASEGGELAGATIPADGRPVVAFARPVRDLARIGAPANPALPPDPVAPEDPVARFSYQLGHVALIRRTGGDRVLAAAGVAAVSGGGVVSLPGMGTLPGAAGGALTLGDRTLAVIGAAAGRLDVSGAPPPGEFAYRFSGTRAAAEVTVDEWAPLGAGFARATLSADPGIADDALGGGTLTAADGAEHMIVGNRAAAVTVRAPADPPPPTGSAQVAGPPGPRLEGVWLPDDTDPELSPTKLMLGARTPFAHFRFAESAAGEFAKRNPRYACGPDAVEEPVCAGFGELPLGPLKGRVDAPPLDAIAGSGVEAVAGREGRELLLGPGPPRDDAGSVVFRFAPPVERAHVVCRTEEGGRVVGRREGVEVAGGWVPRGDYGTVVLSGEMDEVEVSGSLTFVARVCFLPGWVCAGFLEEGFPQGSTGRLAYGELELESAGRMTVAGGVLRAAAVRARRDDSLRKGGGARREKRATLTVHLPRPVTRARVRLRARASVSAHGASGTVERVVGHAGEEVLLRSASGSFDRLVVAAGGRGVRLDRVCLEAGDLGRRRLEQWEWRTSVRRSIESLYEESPVLQPGAYRLRVVTGWADETGTTPGPTEWRTDDYDFTVGPPPGLGSGGGDSYPGGGPLNDLDTYVERTLPVPGERPFYRSYDVAASFSEDYVSRLFAAAASPLSVAVVDANGNDVRAGAPNVWGRGPELAMSVEEQDWMATLHGDGGEPCATIDAEAVVRNETVRAGAGELLAPSALHRGELRAAGRALYGFDFVTSRFASFAHHLSSFDGACHAVGATGTVDPAALAPPLRVAWMRLRMAAMWLDSISAAVESGSPTATQLTAWRDAKEAVGSAREELRAAHQSAYEAAEAALGLTTGRALPEAVRVSRAGNALLIESGEPIPWERVELEASRRDAVPLRRREVTFDRDSFGAPDAGAFRFAGFDWTSSAELWAARGGATARVDAPWTLRLECPRGRSVSVRVSLGAGGSATLVADGAGASPDAAAGPPAGEGAVETLTVSAAPLRSARLSLSGATLLSVTVLEPFQPHPPVGPARLAAVRLPASAGDFAHRVDVVGFADADLGGWRLRWLDALAPAAAAADYHRFPAGHRLRDGGTVRVYGGLATAAPEPGLDVLAGGLAGALPPTGALFQLVDPAGRVVDELAATPSAGAVGVTDHLLAPNGDGTRALLIAPAARLAPGRWALRFTMHRDAGRSLPVLSVGGETAAETAAIELTVE